MGLESGIGNPAVKTSPAGARLGPIISEAFGGGNVSTGHTGLEVGRTAPLERRRRSVYSPGLAAEVM
jgi:hypothetical protein